MKTWLIPVLLAVTCCTTFDNVQRSTCGNGLLEPGEDCDSKDPTCVKCAVVCTQTGPATQCPTTDYRCGVDGFCHAPGGALAPAIALGAFQVDDYAITDIDHDRIGDMLGISTSSLVIRHGDAAATFGTLDSFVTPPQTGNAGLADLDQDGSLDVTITTRDGLVAYASPFGTLSPLIVPSAIGGGTQLADIRMAFSVSPIAVGAFVVDTGRIVLLVADFGAAGGFAAALPCGLVTPAEFNPAMVETYQVNRENDVATDLVVALVTGTGATAKACVLAIHKDNVLALATITNITPAGIPALKRRPVLADLDNDNDRCPNLITSEAGAPALRHWGGVMGAGHCTLQASVMAGGDPLPPIPNSPASVLAIGHVLLDPVPLPLGSSVDALVTNDGAYVLQGNAFGSIYQSTRRLNRAVNADLNGDGYSDAVLSAEGQDDLDVLFRVPSFFTGFQLFRIDTASEVTTITLDDFDGNGKKDIAYTERLADHQRMMVAYDTSDYPLPPVAVGTFGEITSVFRAQFPSSDDPLNRNADLIVVQPTVPSTLSVLYGSTQRTMIPYIEPRSNNVTMAPLRLKENTTFRSALVGHFSPSGGQFPDVVGIAPPNGNSTLAAVRGWLLPGSSHGLDSTANDGFVVTGVVDCAVSSANGVCIENAAIVALPVSTTKDVALAIDRSSPPHIAIIDPSSFGGGAVAAMPNSALAITAGNIVHTLLVEDVDGDGKKDLVAAFAPVNRTSPAKGMVLVCQLANGIPQTCSDIAPVIFAATPATKSCVDVAVAHVAYRDPSTPTNAIKDLLVLCRDDASSLYRVHHEADGYHADLLEHGTGQWFGVRSGDVTGDGVDDVVILDGDKGSRSLIVYPQCTSRDTVRCKLASAGAGPGSKP